MNATANINLKVPFAEKDQAKSLGARWNGELKVWYVPPGTDSAPFAKWFTDAVPTVSTVAAPKKTASKVNSSFDNTPPQSLDGLSNTSEDAEIDAINAMLRDASEVSDLR
jgi:hypothetical protein